jgi:hypothetical protein
MNRWIAIAGMTCAAWAGPGSAAEADAPQVPEAIAPISARTQMLQESLQDRIQAEAEVVILESEAPGAGRLSRRLRALAEEDLQAFVEEALFNDLEFGGSYFYEARHLARWIEAPRLGLEHGSAGYGGGAHGWSATSYSSWIVQGEHYRRLELRDWFDADSTALAVLERALLDSLRAREAAWVLDGSLTGFDRARLEDCLPGPGGLRYTFNDYEVNPYSAGPTTLTLPWTLVEPWLPAEAFARRWLPQADPGGR